MGRGGEGGGRGGRRGGEGGRPVMLGSSATDTHRSSFDAVTKGLNFCTLPSDTGTLGLTHFSSFPVT